MAYPPIVSPAAARYAPHPGDETGETWPLSIEEMTRQLLGQHQRARSPSLIHSSAYDNRAEAAAGAAALVNATHQAQAQPHAPPPGPPMPSMPHMTSFGMNHDLAPVLPPSQAPSMWERRRAPPPPLRLPSNPSDVFNIPSVVLTPPDDEPGHPISLYPRNSDGDGSWPPPEVVRPIVDEPPIALEEPSPRASGFSKPNPPFGRRFSAAAGAVMPKRQPPQQASKFDAEWDNLSRDLPSPNSQVAPPPRSSSRQPETPKRISKAPETPKETPNTKQQRRRTLSLSALFTRKKPKFADAPPLPHAKEASTSSASQQSTKSDRSTKRKTLMSRASLKDLFSAANPDTPRKSLRKSKSKPELRTADVFVDHDAPPVPRLPPLKTEDGPVVVPDALAALTANSKSPEKPKVEIVPDVFAAFNTSTSSINNVGASRQSMAMYINYADGNGSTSSLTRMRAANGSTSSPPPSPPRQRQQDTKPSHLAQKAAVQAQPPSPPRQPQSPPKMRTMPPPVENKPEKKRRSLSKRLSLSSLSPFGKKKPKEEAPDVPALPQKYTPAQTPGTPTRARKVTKEDISPPQKPVMNPRSLSGMGSPTKGSPTKAAFRRSASETQTHMARSSISSLPMSPISPTSAAFSGSKRTSRVPVPRLDEAIEAHADKFRIPEGPSSTVRKMPDPSISKRATMPASIAARRAQPLESMPGPGVVGAVDGPVDSVVARSAPSEEPLRITSPVAGPIAVTDAPAPRSVTAPAAATAPSEPAAAAAPAAATAAAPIRWTIQPAPRSSTLQVSIKFDSTPEDEPSINPIELAAQKLSGQIPPVTVTPETPKKPALGLDNVSAAPAVTVTVSSTRISMPPSSYHSPTPSVDTMSTLQSRDGTPEPGSPSPSIAAEVKTATRQSLLMASVVASTSVSDGLNILAGKPITEEPHVESPTCDATTPTADADGILVPTPRKAATLDHAHSEPSSPVDVMETPRRAGSVPPPRTMSTVIDVSKIPSAPSSMRAARPNSILPAGSIFASVASSVKTVVSSALAQASEALDDIDDTLHETFFDKRETPVSSPSVQSASLPFVPQRSVSEPLPVKSPRTHPEPLPLDRVPPSPSWTSQSGGSIYGTPTSEIPDFLDSPTMSTTTFESCASNSSTGSNATISPSAHLPTYTRSPLPYPVVDELPQSSRRRSSIPAALAATARRRTASSPITATSVLPDTLPSFPAAMEGERPLPHRSVSMPTNTLDLPVPERMNSIAESTPPDSPLNLQMPPFVVPFPSDISATRGNAASTVDNYPIASAARERTRQDSKEKEPKKRDSGIASLLGGFGFARRGQTVDSVLPSANLGRAGAAPQRFEQTARHSLGGVMDYSARTSRGSGVELAMWAEATEFHGMETIADEDKRSDDAATIRMRDCDSGSGCSSSGSDEMASPGTPQTPEIDTPLQPEAYETPIKRVAREPFRALHSEVAY